VLEIEQRGPDIVVLKRTKQAQASRTTFAKARKAASNRRLKNLCSALQSERNRSKVREIKEALIEEFYRGDKAV
jgi:hypothetical protein